MSKENQTNKLRDEIYARVKFNHEIGNKAMLAYPGLALAFSLSFLKSFIPEGMAWYTWLLIFSWVFFGLSVLIGLWGSFTAVEKGQEIDDALSKEDEKEAKRIRDSVNRKIYYSNKIAFWLFVCGIILVTLFPCFSLIFYGKPNSTTSNLEKRSEHFLKTEPFRKLENFQSTEPAYTKQKNLIKTKEKTIRAIPYPDIPIKPEPSPIETR